MKISTTLAAVLFLFACSQRTDCRAQEYQADTVHRNMVAFSITGVMATQFAFHYERFITKNFIIDLPMVYGDLPPANCGESFTNILYAGMNANYCIPNGHNLRYFAGLGFRYGIADYKYEKCNNDGDYLGKDVMVVKYWKVYMNNGITFNMWKRVPVVIMLSLGPKFYYHPYTGEFQKRNFGYFTIDVGYKF